MAKDFFKSFIDDFDDPDTALAVDGKSPAEFSGFIDTGSYILNAAVSGSLFRGIPNNKAIVFAGESTTGKTYFALGILRNFLDTDPRARGFIFDTEAAITQEMLVERGIDPARVAISAPQHIQHFRNTASKLLDKYAELAPKDRFPALLILDSLSMLPSRKEVEDTKEESDKKDMSKPGEIKGTFRILRLKLAKVGMPMLVTNHVYVNIGGYGNQKTVAGGSGAIYASDSIVMLSKRAEKIDDERVGSVVHVSMLKSRLSREGTKVDTRILYDGGLDRYYGLLTLAEDAGLFKKVAGKYELPDGSKQFEKTINRNPAKFFTKDILDTLDAYVATKFRYVPPTDVTVEQDDDDAEA
jgi:RecA/RadA recombinase